MIKQNKGGRMKRIRRYSDKKISEIFEQIKKVVNEDGYFTLKTLSDNGLDAPNISSLVIPVLLNRGWIEKKFRGVYKIRKDLL
jgi:predicted transcriptional regulator of viral defense system